MTGQIVSTAQANLKMALWQVDADSMTSNDLYAWLVDSGLPHEVTIRLHELANYTKKSGSKVLAVGKIVLIKILEFVKAHPFLVMGAGISAVVGAAVASLITAVPLLGQLLAPVAMALGITITAIGAVAGHRMDKCFQGVGEDIFEIAQEFFKLLSDVFNTVFRNVITA
ncbi:hypothetical protein [Allocoleopsis franciscana]|uniref:Small integral membrane protein n=1 Tax=Allocoleopsis franciscana PCC 7113 TaxID=1173027 RepID=K9WEQ8_9CYAN|nr:hypothetical protein [Allocoleopsis franciscana]AFZ18286.1 hypothetical protein Mic7113_2485 [Allocoleopsis franciscana PCC 7113]